VLKLFRLNLIAFGMLVAGCAGMAPLCWWILFGSSDLLTIRLHDGTIVRIIAEPDRRLDATPALFREIQGGTCLFPGRLYLGTTPGSTKRLHFEALVLDDGRLVAVYERSRPHFFNVLYDSRSGEVWPFNDGQGGYPEVRAAVVGERLVGRVRELTSDKRYQFGYFNDPVDKDP
jgi:hypothetical protein